jgi:Fe-S-cluster-containing dehydrogenase component
MTKSHLIIDLAVCDRCRAGTVSPAEHGEAGHATSQSAGNGGCAVDCAGMLALREKATFESVCRRCEVASCILACPFDALERTQDGIIKRHNLRCVSCKSCAIACPFGTIYMELLPFYSVDYSSACRSCLATGSSSRKTEPGAAPLCVDSCPEGALEYRQIGPGEEGMHIVDEFLAVRVSERAQRWNRTETAT